MASTYPNPTLNRIPWHKDGTQLWNLDDYTTQEQTDWWPIRIADSVCNALNAEDATVAFTMSPSGVSAPIESPLVLVFPDPITVDGLFIAMNGNISGIVIETCTEAEFTNPQQLSYWTPLTMNTDATTALSSVTPDYRNETTGFLKVLSGPNTSVKALRLSIAVSRGSAVPWYGLFLYGKYEKRMVFWHPTLEQALPVGYLDWSDTPHGDTDEKRFRVKNLSSSKFANNVTLSLIADAEASSPHPTRAENLLSMDGLVYHGSLDLGDLAASQVTPVIRMLRVTPSDSPTGLWAYRLRAEPLNWS